MEIVINLKNTNFTLLFAFVCVFIAFVVMGFFLALVLKLENRLTLAREFLLVFRDHHVNHIFYLSEFDSYRCPAFIRTFLICSLSKNHNEMMELGTKSITATDIQGKLLVFKNRQRKHYDFRK